MKLNILTTCSFANVFKKTEKLNNIAMQQPTKKIGHIRAYYKDDACHMRYFSCHEHLETPTALMELQNTYIALLNDKHFANLNCLAEFCAMHPNACVVTGGKEFNFYIQGILNNYWLRVNIEPDNYNIYLNAYIK